MASNDFFQRMCREAAEEMASGDKGWREMDTNTVVMACFHLLNNHLSHKLTKPLWFFASSVGAGVIFYIVKGVFSP